MTSQNTKHTLSVAKIITDPMIYSMHLKALKCAFRISTKLEDMHRVQFPYQSATAAHGEGTLDQGNGLGDSSHHSGYHLGLLSHCDSTRLVHGDNGSGGGGGGRGCCAHLGRSSFKHPGGRVTDLQAQRYFKYTPMPHRMHSMRNFILPDYAGSVP